MTPQSLELQLQAPQPIPILYIDDDPDDCQALVASLSPSIVNPIVCFQEAMELYTYLDANLGPFIVLVDLVLLNHPTAGGGYDILTDLRARTDLTESRSPIIAVTASSPEPVIVERVRKTGADAFIHKPVRVDDLVAAIGRPGWFRVELSR